MCSNGPVWIALSFLYVLESVMPESDAHSRLVLRSNLPGTSEEEPELGDDAARRQEDDDDDNEPPPQFMNV